MPLSINLSSIKFYWKNLRLPWIEPRTTGWEVRLLPLCKAVSPPVNFCLAAVNSLIYLLFATCLISNQVLRLSNLFMTCMGLCRCPQVQILSKQARGFFRALILFLWIYQIRAPKKFYILNVCWGIIRSPKFPFRPRTYMGTRTARYGKSSVIQVMRNHQCFPGKSEGLTAVKHENVDSLEFM